MSSLSSSVYWRKSFIVAGRRPVVVPQRNHVFFDGNGGERLTRPPFRREAEQDI
jgi:hypothetical protein